MVNYPGSLDSLSNPGATTKRNDPGFELHTVISTLNDIAEALEARAGVGASNGTPVADSVYVGTGTGTSRWLAGLTTPYLAANAVTQTTIAAGSSANPTRTGATTYADLTDMSATLTTVGGELIAIILGSFYGSTSTEMSLALSLDGAAEVRPMAVNLGGSANLVGTMARFTGVSAASHTVKGRWSVANAAHTITAYSTYRYLLLAELKR